MDNITIILEALNNLEFDSGALFEAPVLSVIRDLHKSNPAVYERVRQEAKASKKVSMSNFDQITKSVRQDTQGQTNCLFPHIEPCLYPVDGAVLLTQIERMLSRHIIADKETLRAATLWCVFTWFIDAVNIAPIANITAPEKRCGKSEMLSVMGRLVYRSFPVSGVSTAALFRSIEAWQPTLMIDEVDAFLKENEEARGILNAGFTRDSAYILRCVGDDHMPTRFNVWGAKALCGIGKIADTLADRSIPLRLRRKLPHESIQRLRFSDPEEWDDIRGQIARFADDNRVLIEYARPEPIEGLNDRANDCWEPLLAIAEAAGGKWPDWARNAAIALHGIEEETPTIGVELLQDIKAVLENYVTPHIFTVTLIEQLTEDDEKPWANWNRGKPITPRQVASKLAEFGIKSKDVRIGSKHRKGYSKTQFKDAWTRYLAPPPLISSATTRQPRDAVPSDQYSEVTRSGHVAEKKWGEASVDAGCHVVADSTPSTASGKLFSGEI